MPRYFFDVVSEGEVREDQTGVDVENEGDLKDLATRRAGEWLHAALQDQPIEWWLLEIKNGSRETVGRVSFVVSGFAAADDPTQR